MPNPVQTRQARVHHAQERGQVRAPMGVAAAPTTMTSASGSPQPSVGVVEGLLIRFKNLLVWFFQWMCCSKPADYPLQQQLVQAVQPPPRRVIRQNQPATGSHRENMLLLLRLQQKSDLQQEHILIQIGNEIYKKSGAAGYYTYFRQTPEAIGRNAIAANPQLLKPFIQ